MVESSVNCVLGGLEESVGSLFVFDMMNCTVVVSVACESVTVMVIGSVTGVLV